MYDRAKRKRNFHVNMLRKWYSPSASSCYAEDVTGTDSEEIPSWSKGVVPESDHSPIISEHLTGAPRRTLKNLLDGYPDVLSNKPGRTTLGEHDIKIDKTGLIRLQPYRLPHAYRETVQEELRAMEQEGMIEPSTSEWAAPIVLVRKKDGSIRLCVDYRKLNILSKVDAYPMPWIDELIDRLGRAEYITTLDLT